MDSSGKIHGLPPAVFEHERLEKETGPLLPIPADDLDAVKAMSDAQRRRWWFERATRAEKKRARKLERKRERAARKAGRR